MSRFEGRLLKKQEKDDNITPFTVIDGGLAQPKTAGKEPPFEDWLTPMTPQTIFLAGRKNSGEAVLTEFTVINHSENAVKLKATENEFWVKPRYFCQGMELVDVLQRGYSE